MNPPQTDCPGALLHLDALAKFAIEDRFLPLETHREFFPQDRDLEIFCSSPLLNGDYDVDFTELLFPCVGKG